MKISKLKYVLAFMLVVVVSTVTANVKAVTAPSGETISVKTIIASLAAEIVDGDDDTTASTGNEVYVFNSSYSTSSSALGSALNPVHSYAIKDSSGIYYKVYGLNYSEDSTTKDDIEYAGVGSGTSLDNTIGLALVFGLGSLTSDDAANQGSLGSYVQAQSFATQMYIWMAQAGLIGTSTESAIVNANLSGTALSVYQTISNSVEQVQYNPSYTYATQAEANSQACEMTWNSTTGRYEYTVTDANGLDTMSLVSLIIQTNSGIQYTKNGNSVTFYTTEQVGSASSPICIPVYKSINNGRYIPGYATNTVTGQSFVYLSGMQNSNTVSYISLYTNALRIQVTKSLGASSTNSNTGDATVEGAVYGIYSDSSCTNLVAQLIIGSDGTAISNPLEYKTYYVKEITQSEGTKIDTATYPATVSAAVTNANGQKVVYINSTDNVIYGGFRMIISVSDLSGNTTKDPAVGSVLTLTLDSDPTQTYTATVDDQGYAEFVNIPYGTYTCTETYHANEDLDYMDPMSIYINSEETYIYSKIVNTEVAQRYIKIVKIDEETGVMIPSANTTFRIVDDATGATVVQTSYYPYETELTYYTTDEAGYLVMPEKLPYGSYTIYEITAPDGYYNVSAATGVASAKFSVETNEPDGSGDEMVVVEVPNIAQKVNVTISTRGEVLVTTNSETDEGYTVERPTYTNSAIPGAKYVITAVEDIDTGEGTIRMAAGETIELVSDSTGLITTKLYLGTYTIQQVSVPEGYVLDDTVYTIDLQYKGQLIKEWNYDTIYYTLVKQEYDVQLTKEFSDLYFYRENANDTTTTAALVSYADVVVGIYAAEDITNVYGTVVIEKDELVDVVRFNNDGTASVTGLPMGNYYVKELETNENYEVSTEEYDFAAVPTNYTDYTFTIDVDTIVNYAKKVTTLTLTKIEEVEVEVDEEDGDGNSSSVLASLIDLFEQVAEGLLEGSLVDLEQTVDVTRLEGAVYAIYYESNDGNYYPLLEMVEGEKVEVVRTTDENGEITLEGLPYGDYAVQEITAPTYYNLDESMYEFTVTTSEPKAELVLQDVRTLVDVTVEVVDEDGALLEGVQVDLVDPDTNEVVYSNTTDEEGIATFEQIRAGRYIRVVSGVAEMYVTPDDAELYVEEDSEVTVTVRYIVGNILVYKTDSETGLPVAGCTFTITNEADEVVAEGQSDENGYYLVEGLRYGVYLVEETEAAEGYERDATIYQVTINEDGITVEVDFTNVPTGDIAVAMYVMVALISIAVIAKTVKKLKAN